MRPITDLSHQEQRVVSDLRREVARRLPDLRVRMTVFGSSARGDAEAESDMDVLLEVETPRVAPSDRQRLRDTATELSLALRQHPRRGDRGVSEREVRELVSKAE